jgi:hypothetical protein
MRGKRQPGVLVTLCQFVSATFDYLSVKKARLLPFWHQNSIGTALVPCEVFDHEISTQKQA